MLLAIQKFFLMHPIAGACLAISAAMFLFVFVLIFYISKINPPTLVDSEERPVDKIKPNEGKPIESLNKEEDK